MSNEKLKLGLICVCLAGERNDLGEVFHRDAIKKLTGRNVKIVNADSKYTLSAEEVEMQTKLCENNGADAIIYLCGTWLLANHIVDSVRELKTPFIIWGIPEPISFSSVGANVVRGILGEMGIKHKLVCGWPNDEDTLDEIISFGHAASIKKALTHARLGLIGGRTISAYPTSADPNQIKKIFGIEVDHIDQLVVLEKARKADRIAVATKIEDIKSTFGSVDVPDDELIRAVSVYFALKEIIDEYDLDMLSLKCIGEFMDSYVSGCIALALLNDEGFVCNCQCNINALISAYIATKLSGEPNFFGDVNCVNTKTGDMRLINCGSIAPSLAVAPSEVKIVQQYEYMGAGRGACTLFCMKPGKVTIGTLGRDNGNYVMNIASGEAYTQPEEELIRVRAWAQGFVKLDCNPKVFYQNLRCNHSVVAYGDFKKELIELCRMYDIKPETTEE